MPAANPGPQARLPPSPGPPHQSEPGVFRQAMRRHIVDLRKPRRPALARRARLRLKTMFLELKDHT